MSPTEEHGAAAPVGRTRSLPRSVAWRYRTWHSCRMPGKGRLIELCQGGSGGARRCADHRCSRAFGSAASRRAADAEQRRRETASPTGIWTPKRATCGHARIAVRHEVRPEGGGEPSDHCCAGSQFSRGIRRSPHALNGGFWLRSRCEFRFRSGGEGFAAVVTIRDPHSDRLNLAGISAGPSHCRSAERHEQRPQERRDRHGREDRRDWPLDEGQHAAVSSAGAVLPPSSPTRPGQPLRSPSS